MKELRVNSKTRLTELWKLGFEGKHDPSQGEWGSFLAMGYLKKPSENLGGSLGELKGNGGYLGIGWEFPFEILGLAFEIA